MTRLTPKDLPEAGIGLLRIGTGLLLALLHGWPTLTDFLEGSTQAYPDPLGIGSKLTMALMVFAEFFCALLLALGLYTRLVLIPLLTAFAVAFFIHHAQDPLAYKELSLHYLFIFLVLFITGPGKFSLQSLIQAK